MKNSLTRFKKFETKVPRKMSGGDALTWIEDEYVLDGTYYCYVCYMGSDGWTSCSTYEC